MRDETYAFISDVKDRKSIARSAKYKKNGSKSHACSLPSDRLTKKERERMNGTVNSYTMNNPHTWAEIKTWPEDIRTEYLKRIVDKYHPYRADLAAMLDLSETHVSHALSNLGVQNRKKPTDEQKEAFLAWINGVPLVYGPSEDERVVYRAEEEPVICEEEPVICEEEPVICEEEKVDTRCGHAKVDSFSLTLRGTAEEITASMLDMLCGRCGENQYVVTITAYLDEEV